MDAVSAAALAGRQRPGLSETLTGTRAPGVCQNCDARPDLVKDYPRRWIECDPRDRHDAASPVVVLCGRCSGKLIECHARLYVQLDPGVPHPGCMAICVDCAHRDGTRCSHAHAKANGGAGVELTCKSPPVQAHFNYGGGRGEFRLIYSSVTDCREKEVSL